MGYTTDFEGSFKLDRKLDTETYELLEGLATTRRMARNLEGFGVQGEFFIDKGGNYGQNETPDIIDYNRPPSTQPSLWCQWAPSKDGLSIKWDGGEKFYEYVKWLRYLIENVLKPRGYGLSGEVTWTGEDNEDMGKILVTANKVVVKNGYVNYK